MHKLKALNLPLEAPHQRMRKIILKIAQFKELPVP
jgi:hypothetical protein